MRYFPSGLSQVAWSLLLLLSSCLSMSQKEKTQYIIQPPSLNPSVQSALEYGSVSMGLWPKEGWWSYFESEELTRLIETALRENPSIQMLEQRVAFSQQIALGARSKLFPLLYFNASDTILHLSQHGLEHAFNPNLPLGGYQIDLGLSFFYEFDFWGKNRNLWKATLGEVKVQEAELAQTQLIVSTALAQAYFSLITNLEREVLYQELCQVRSKKHELQQLLYGKALESKLPFLLTEERAEEAKKLLASIQEEIAVNQHIINMLAGKGPDEPIAITHVERPHAILEVPEHLSLDLLARRPDLIGALWHVEALSYEVGAAIADFFPNIDLTASGGIESLKAATLFRGSSLFGQLLPALHLPIFTAGKIRANVDAKKARFQEAVFAYNELILKSASEVADILAFTTSIHRQMIDQKKILTAAHLRLTLTELKMHSGLDNLLMVYDRKEEWIEKKLEEVLISYDQYLAQIKLIKALGGGYCEKTP
jgi:NodT family efflux transporter outer membrane factor (OMF) lipoprotein